MAPGDVLVVIPARMASTRFPGKPLAELCGRPMIVHVVERAEAAAVGRVVVATDSREIVAAVNAAGGRTVLTGQHASGSDRVHEAASLVDPERRVQIVVNLQGDMPAIEAGAIRATIAPLSDAAVDIATLAAAVDDGALGADPNVVKVVGATVGPRRLRALYFTRAAAPWGEGPLYHHFGLYAFRRAALESFVALPPSPLERREGLEQLRALEAGMRIDVAIVDRPPVEVNTPEDLEPACRALAPSSAALP